MERSLNNEGINEKTCCNTKCKLAFSVTGIIVGLIAFALFCFKFHNWNAALWALLSGIVALSVSIVLVQDLRDGWRTHHSKLKYLMLSGCFMQLAGFTGFIVYLVLAISQHQGVDAYGEGFYVTMVWCFMTFKWGSAMFFYSRCFKRRYMPKIYYDYSETDPIISKTT